MQLKSLILALTALTAFGATQATELVTNGGFETTTAYGQINQSVNGVTPIVDGWSTNGFSFIANASNIGGAGVDGVYGKLALWSTANGGATALSASPVGGNFIAADGAYENLKLSQTVSGLHANQQYQLTFYWAGAQQYTYDGVTTERWDVSLGDQVKSTVDVTNQSHSSTGWQKEVMTFTATSGTEVLSFLAQGTPGGEPPFSLLDGVSLQTMPVPEPSAWAMLAAGLALLGFAVRRNKSKAG